MMEDNNLNQVGTSLTPSEGNHLMRNVFVAIAVIAVIVIIVLAIVGKKEQSGPGDISDEEVLEQLAGGENDLLSGASVEEKNEVLDQLSSDPADDLPREQKSEILRQLAQ